MHSYYLSQWIIFFFIYSFIGWIWESGYVSAKKRRWVNRGFMHGPVLPIYGSGAVVVLIATLPVRGNIPLVFLLGMAAATVLEYFTGAAMERLFHVRYWDYSNMKFNLKGYVCLPAALCWGCFSILMTEAVHPPVEEAVLSFPLKAVEYAAVILSVAAAVDFTQSFNEAMDMRNVLAQLEESRQQIRKMRERLKLTAEDAAEDYRRRSEEMRENVSGRRAALVRGIHERREAYRKLLEEMASRADKNYLHALSHLRRNPTAVSKRFRGAVEELQKIIEENTGNHTNDNEGENR